MSYWNRVGSRVHRRVRGLVDRPVDFVVQLLIREGPMLPFPYSSGVSGAKKYDVRELRIQHQGRPYRVLYVFDPRRHAILLIGGDKIAGMWSTYHSPRRFIRSTCRN